MVLPRRQQSTYAPAEAICRVCGTVVGDAPVICPDCMTPHHRDCWDYNGGCATYACPSSAFTPRPTGQPGPLAEELPKGKIPFPQLRTGTFLGVFYVTWPTAFVAIFAEIAAIATFGLSVTWALRWIGVMVAAFAWAAMTAEVNNLDVKNGYLTRSKLILGFEVFEWNVVALSRIAELVLMPCMMDETPMRKLVARFAPDRVPWWSVHKDTFDLTPPFEPGSVDDLAVDELLYTIEACSELPVRIALPAAKGATYAPTPALASSSRTSSDASGDDILEFVIIENEDAERD